MKQITTILFLALVCLMTSCSKGKFDEKGFRVSPASDDSEVSQVDGFNRDSLQFETRPGGILLTGVQNVRLTTVYKVNFNKKRKTTFTGSNEFHYSYDGFDNNTGNNWNYNLMPGIKSVYGYNLVNISHYDIKENKQKDFFENPVLIRTLYYPTPSKDTLNYEPANRNYFIVTVYNEDTNKDGFINIKDLRRIYLFDINGEKQRPLVPENYSVFKSQYDPYNDFMYVYTQLDANENGRQDEGEPIHIFWIDLKDPDRTGQQY